MYNDAKEDVLQVFAKSLEKLQNFMEYVKSSPLRLGMAIGMDMHEFTTKYYMLVEAFKSNFATAWDKFDTKHFIRSVSRMLKALLMGVLDLAIHFIRYLTTVISTMVKNAWNLIRRKSIRTYVLDIASAEWKYFNEEKLKPFMANLGVYFKIGANTSWKLLSKVYVDMIHDHLTRQKRLLLKFGDVDLCHRLYLQTGHLEPVTANHNDIILCARTLWIHETVAEYGEMEYERQNPLGPCCEK